MIRSWVRDVALKILPPAFRSDADRLARFEREARALAALNHPNIATIHGLEEHQGMHALILELVDGETLAEMIDGFHRGATSHARRRYSGDRAADCRRTRCRT
jgi:serine/threonine protein kinase